jgi:hypothetical protein
MFTLYFRFYDIFAYYVGFLHLKFEYKDKLNKYRAKIRFPS